MDERHGGLRLWLVRHGQTAGNEEGWVQGRIDTPLNQSGRREARLLGERMAFVPLIGLYSSPLRRALDTASIIGKRAGLPVVVLDELAEIEMGRWEGRPFREVDTGKQLDGRWVFGPDRDVLGPCESLGDLMRRGRSALATMMAEHHEGDLCVAAHAAVILGIVSACLGLPDGAFLPPILIGNGSVSLLEYRLGRWLLVFVNDRHHLGEARRHQSDMMTRLFGRPDGVQLV